jgi:L-asparaginase II
MLLLCREHGWPRVGYHSLEHPCQQAMLSEVAAAAEVEPARVATAVDGCGVPAFALTLERMAHAFSRLERLDGGDRVARAMRAYPELIRGPLAADTILMRALPGWIAKGGAEGLLCAASPDGLGIALKVEDGATQSVRAGMGAFLDGLGIAHGAALGPVAVESSRGEVVGEIRAV